MPDMKPILVVLAAGVSVFGTLPFVLHSDWFYLPALVLTAALAVILWKVTRPWWIGSVLFGFMGISQLIARFWLRARVGHSEPALDTFGPGFLVMAVFYFFWNRRFAARP